MTSACLGTALLLFSTSLLAQELRLDIVRESLTGTHRTYRQFIDGIEVAGAARIESDTIDGRRAIMDRLATRPLTRSAAALALPARGGELVYVNVDGEARLARRVATEERRLEPWARYYDAATGALLRAEPLFFTAQGRVFDVNPVAKLNDPALQDGNNAASAVPPGAYSTVELQGLAGSGPLIGPYVAISDLESPSPTPADASQSLLFDRSDPRFEEVNAYFQLDRTQRYLQSLGYIGTRQIIPYAIPVDPHAANGTDNSYYLPGALAGRGLLYFGDGGTDDAEDADIMLHEYGHAIEDWIAPLTFAGTISSQSRALGEGFGDYWSFSSNYEATVASGRDPYCIGDWDARCANDDALERCGYPAGANCLRRVDGTKTMADFVISDSSGTEHRNGEIWSSALREIFLAVGKRTTDTLVLESHFGVPPNPTFAVMARRMVDADRLLYGGRDAATICTSMAARGIVAASDCSLAPRGERTLFQSPDRGLAIPENNSTGIVSRLVITDARTIEKLFVRLDIAHTARGDLRITLVAPDGTAVLLADASLDRTADIHATYGIDAQPAQSLDVFRGKSAAGEWQLRIADLHPKDTGALLDWGLVIQFAGDAPSSTRPAAAEHQTIAAVVHGPGANGTNWVSDVRLLNRGAASRVATLVFTPTGADGRATFSAIRVELPAGEVVALDDVVASMFATTGGGQLQIDARAIDVVASSRTYTRTTGGGTYGQFIPATPSSAVSYVTQLKSTPDFRSNVGFAETEGAAGVVRVSLYDGRDGALLAQFDQAIAPFGHSQFPIAGSGLVLAELRVIDGGARIAGYGSVIDNRTGDPIYVPGQQPRSGAFIAPAITASGANGTSWQTEVAFAAATAGDAVASLRIYEDGRPRDFSLVAVAPHQTSLTLLKVPFGAVRIDTNTNILASVRIFTGAFAQFVPFQPIVEAPSPRDLLHIESSAGFRTNIGAIDASDAEAHLRFTLFDAAGRTMAITERTLRPWETIQFPIGALTSAPLRDGRVRVEILDGRAFVAWASVVDNVTGDPIFVPGQ
ncbi:MAG TPA: proprotein convertase P-domain-containing protein [Thermoanaerobaculia bacterium]|nr:proprotein convertase P-domain-containing protein [Thermoanaerobaculia bacterium]